MTETQTKKVKITLANGAIYSAKVKTTAEAAVAKLVAKYAKGATYTVEAT